MHGQGHGEQCHEGLASKIIEGLGFEVKGVNETTKPTVRADSLLGDTDPSKDHADNNRAQSGFETTIENNSRLSMMISSELSLRIALDHYEAVLIGKDFTDMDMSKVYALFAGRLTAIIDRIFLSS